MANHLKVAKVLSIRELHSQGWSQRRIARELGISRGAVSRHLREASNEAKAPTGSDDLNRAKAPTGSDASDELSNRATSEKAPTGSRSLCEPYRELILEKLEAGLSAQRIYQDLVSEQDFPGKYHAVRRYVAKLRSVNPLPFRRMEVGPGEEAQIDFGTGAPIIDQDGRRKRTWVIRVVLSHSRKGLQRSCLSADYRQLHSLSGECVRALRWSSSYSRSGQSQSGGDSCRLVRPRLQSKVGASVNTMELYCFRPSLGLLGTRAKSSGA